MLQCEMQKNMKHTRLLFLREFKKTQEGGSLLYVRFFSHHEEDHVNFCCNSNKTNRRQMLRIIMTTYRSPFEKVRHFEADFGPTLVFQSASLCQFQSLIQIYKKMQDMNFLAFNHHILIGKTHVKIPAATQQLFGRSNVLLQPYVFSLLSEKVVIYSCLFFQLGAIHQNDKKVTISSY